MHLFSSVDIYVLPSVLQVSLPRHLSHKQSTGIVCKRVPQSDLSFIICSKRRVIRIAPCSHLTSCQNYVRLWLIVGSPHLPPCTHVPLIDANESYACGLWGERALWMFSPTSQLKGWAAKQNIALLFIFITPVFINQISYDEVQASRQYDSADGEHM